MVFGIVLSVVYLGAAGAAPFLIQSIPQTSLEWAYYAGAVASLLALAWLVGPLFILREEVSLPRSELEAQRAELALQRETLQGQSTHQMRTADATLEAAKIARANSFVSSMPMYQARLSKVVMELGKRLPPAQQAGTNTPVRPPRDFQSLIDYLNLMSANNVDLKAQLGPNASDIMALAKEYQLSFKIILGTARETNNTILLLGPIAEVNDRLVRHFGNLA